MPDKYKEYKRGEQTELAKEVVKNLVIKQNYHPRDVAKRLDVSREYIYNIIQEVKE